MQGKLTTLGVARLKTPGMYGDGHGLWLQVAGKGAKSWIFRFTLSGRSREMGLGSASTYSLAEARDRARECRKLTADGVDPIEIRREKRQQAAVEAAKAITFSQCARAYFEAHKSGWRNAAHRQQWAASMEADVYPVFGDLHVQAIDTGLVMKALEQIWNKKAETAMRIRGRIEVVLDWAATRGYRTGENPARWKGHIQNLLPKRSQVRMVKHHAALPFDQVPAFMADLALKKMMTARLLEFTILTAARAGEAAGAQWSELDLEAAVWTVPAERMKSGVEHRVPLTEPALAILRQLEGTGTSLVFRGPLRNDRIDNKVTRDLLARLRGPGLTIHGFRSSFRDWAAERTSFPRDIAEMALAHAVGGMTERAYRRSDLFEKRRELMDAWADYCCKSQE